MKKVFEGLGTRIRAVRGDRSQPVFSRLCGIPQSSLADWEQEKKVPSASAIAAICSATGTDADWLLGLSAERGGVVASGGSAVVTSSPNATATAGAAHGEVDRLLAIIESQQALLRSLAAK